MAVAPLPQVRRVVEYALTEFHPEQLYLGVPNYGYVWFEDARSIQAKLNLAFDYSLYGVGYWNLDRPFPQNWVVVNAMADIRPEM